MRPKNSVNEVESINEIHREVKVKKVMITFALFVCAREGSKKKKTQCSEPQVQMHSQCGIKQQILFHEPFVPLSSPLIRDQTHAAILHLSGKKKGSELKDCIFPHQINFIIFSFNKGQIHNQGQM